MCRWFVAVEKIKISVIADNKKSCVGVDLLLKGGDFGIIPLHDAVQNNRTEIVRLLLQFGGTRHSVQTPLA